jgi:ribonuclease HII
VTAPVPTLRYESALLANGPVAGLDEVGRGALAGPVCVGVVVVTGDAPPPPGLMDSKLLTARQRDALVTPLRQWVAGWAVGESSAAEIDEWGLRLALAVAAHRALERLSPSPATALIDGNLNLLSAPDTLLVAAPPRPFSTLPTQLIVKGDQHSATIAAASVLAKVHRDALMAQLDARYPEYGFASHKGYGAAQHRAAIALHGPSDLHRRTWRLLPD